MLERVPGWSKTGRAPSLHEFFHAVSFSSQRVFPHAVRDGLPTGIYWMAISSLLDRRRLWWAQSAAQGVQEERSADAEANHGGEGHQVEHAARHAEGIREQREHGTENAEDVKPEGRMNAGKIAAKPNLEQQRCQSDRGHDDQGNRTIKSIRPGIDHDQRERQQEQAGSDHGPSARNFRRGRGTGIGLGLRPGTRHPAISSPLRIATLYVGLSIRAQALLLGIHSAGRCSRATSRRGLKQPIATYWAGCRVIGSKSALLRPGARTPSALLQPNRAGLIGTPATERRGHDFACRCDYD